jgi:hypothetical protein
VAALAGVDGAAALAGVDGAAAFAGVVVAGLLLGVLGVEALLELVGVEALPAAPAVGVGVDCCEEDGELLDELLLFELAALAAAWAAATAWASNALPRRDGSSTIWLSVEWVWVPSA